MDLSDLIQKHARELARTAADAVEEKRTEADLARPAQMYRARIERVEARLRLLEQQRAETDKRLADAIETQKRLREELEKEAKAWEERIPDGGNLRGGPSQQTQSGSGSRSLRSDETQAKAKRTAATKASGPKASRSGKSK